MSKLQYSIFSLVQTSFVAEGDICRFVLQFNRRVAQAVFSDVLQSPVAQSNLCDSSFANAANVAAGVKARVSGNKSQHGGSEGRVGSE